MNAPRADGCAQDSLTVQTSQLRHERSGRHNGPKLSRQAILSEDSGTEFSSNKQRNPSAPESTQQIASHNRVAMDLLVGESSISNSIAVLSTSSPSATSEEQIDYSPILTGVRDYIDNVNSDLHLNSGQSPSVLAGSLVPNMCISPDGLPGSVIQTSIAAPAILTTMTLTASASTAESQANTVTLNDVPETSLKKSIFEGASKDEILEYLEDARERVPEVLIAADEVMVIGENELILVNQLRPNLPATSISIVDASEVVTTTELGIQQQVATMVQQPTISGTPVVMPLSLISQSQPVGAMESSISFDEHTSAFAARGFPDGQPSPDNFRSLDQALLSSIEDRSLSLMSSGSDKIRELEHQFANQATDSIDSQIITGFSEEDDQAISTSRRHLLEPSASSMSDSSNKSRDDLNAGNQLCISDRVTCMLRHSTRRKSTSESSSHAESRRANRMLHMQASHSRTQDSISTSSSSSTSSSGSAPSSTTSSSSSTPASTSSTSTSRSSSSNQTSGNCSAASNFYNSPSLSCSSPFLALGANNLSSEPANITRPPQQPSTSTTPCDQPGLSITSTLKQMDLYTTDLLLIQPNSPSGQPLIRDITLAEPAWYDRDQTMVSSIDGAHTQNAATISIQAQQLVERGDSGLGSEASPIVTKTDTELASPDLKLRALLDERFPTTSSEHPETRADSKQPSESGFGTVCASKLSVIEEDAQTKLLAYSKSTVKSLVNSMQRKTITTSRDSGGAKKSIGLGRPSHSHYATINRLNDYLIKRQETNAKEDSTSQDHSMIEFQCLDCDQFIITDQARVLRKANELRLLREAEIESLDNQSGQEMSMEQIDRAYVAALNDLPLCKTCEKKRSERKEIISEFVDTELKYGRDLKIIHDEFYRPMQIAGLLNKDQINGIFLNLDELIMAHCRFAERLDLAINAAQSIGDTDYNTVNIGKLFVESAEMLHTFESYCIRQGSAACLLARLAKEKELLRIFLRVSQMENTLLRRMNLAAFLMVPVQRVTKYPLLLNRLYKVTAYHHKDREALRDAQLKVELHLEHINQQTKGISATNKIWRRISALSASSSTANSRRCLISAEDIGYIKLRKTAMELLNWDRDETQFIHSGKISFAALNEYLVKQKMKSLRYMSAHALLIVLGKPNWKYRPDLVKSNMDSKHLVPTSGGNGIKEAALLLFREKNGRFVPCREPLLLSNCVLSSDCSQFNYELPHSHFNSKQNANSSAVSLSNPVSNLTPTLAGTSSLLNRRSSPGVNNSTKRDLLTLNEFRAASAESQPINIGGGGPSDLHSLSLFSKELDQTSDLPQGDSISMSSLKSLPEERGAAQISPPIQTSRSYSLASALPRVPITTVCTNSIQLNKSMCSTTSSLNILNPFKSKSTNNSAGVNISKQQVPESGKSATIVSDDLKSKTTNCGHRNGKIKTSASTSSADSFASTNMHDSTQVGSGQVTGSRGSNGSIGSTMISGQSAAALEHQPNHQYNHHFFHNHHQPYGDYEESFEIHESSSKDSLLLRADTPLKTRYWLQMLRYHAKDLGHWRVRRQGLANIMMMRQE